MDTHSLDHSPHPAAEPVTPARTIPSTLTPKVADALKVYTWATIEAKNILRCISIATDHGDAVDDDLRPAIGIAIDGVVRLLAGVSRQFEHLDGGIHITEHAAEVNHG